MCILDQVLISIPRLLLESLPSNSQHKFHLDAPTLPTTAQMATDYSKKKNDELQDLLRARGLSHTGKKAELVARLQQHDADQASKPAKNANSSSKAAATTGAEDEIDWEDDAIAASTEAGAAAIAAGGQTQPPNPTAVPNQAVDTDPSKTNDLSVDPPAATTSEDAAAADTSTKPAPDFSSNLPSTTVDSELEKRKKRAARFGLAESNEDALKALERAKKFGTGTAGDKAGVKGLDEALPEQRPKRGRGGDGVEGGGGRQGKRSRVRGERDGGGAAKASGAWMSEKDRAAAEARKRKFGS